MGTLMYCRKWEDINDGFDAIGLPYFKGDRLICKLLLKVEDNKNGNTAMMLPHSDELALIYTGFYPAQVCKRIKKRRGRPRKTDREQDVQCYYGFFRNQDGKWVRSSLDYVRCDEVTLDEMKQKLEEDMVMFYVEECKIIKEQLTEKEKRLQDICTVLNYELKDDVYGTMG